MLVLDLMNTNEQLRTIPERTALLNTTDKQTTVLTGKWQNVRLKKQTTNDDLHLVYQLETRLNR